MDRTNQPQMGPLQLLGQMCGVWDQECLSCRWMGRKGHEMSWKMGPRIDRDSVSSHQPCRRMQGSALSWKAPSAVCGKEMEVWVGFEEIHPPLEGEEQEHKTVLESEVPLWQLLHQAAIEC